MFCVVVVSVCTDNLERSFHFTEHIDIHALRVILHNWDKAFERFQEKQPLKLKNCRNEQILPSADARKYLSDILTLKVRSPDVTYHFAGKSKFGRRYANGVSLQGMQRSLRHTLGSSLYFDIDIKNCHPTILLHWCTENNVAHPRLTEYVNNRDSVIDGLVNKNLRKRIGHRFSDVPMTKDDLKEAFLSMINGGQKLETLPSDDMIVSFYTDHQRVMKTFCENAKNAPYVERAKEKAGKKKAMNDAAYENVQGSALNLYFCSVEDSIMCTVEKYLKDQNIRIGTLCFDGALIYKENVSDVLSFKYEIIIIIDIRTSELMNSSVLSCIRQVNKLCADLSGYVSTLFDHKYVFCQKPMTLGIRIDDMDAPIFDDSDKVAPPARSASERFGPEMLTTDTEYARFLFELLKPVVLVAKHQQTEFWMYNETDRLWHSNTDLSKVLGFVYVTTLLYDYIEQLSDTDLSKAGKRKEAVRVSNTPAISSIFRVVQNMFEVSLSDDTLLIDSRMDQTPGLLPLKNGLTLDLKTGKSRARTRDDYFSRICPFAPVNLTQDERRWIQNYFTELLRVRLDDGTIEEPSSKHVSFLQYCLSYVLTGEVNAAVWFQFSGKGSNGKSSLLKILNHYLGKFGVPGNPRAWALKDGQASPSHDAERIALIGTRLCALTELDENSFFDAEFLKKTSAGDMQSFRECHGTSRSTIQNKLTCVVIAATNHLIPFEKVDLAFIRRMCCFLFGNLFEQDPNKEAEISAMGEKIMTVLCEVATQVYSDPRGFKILYDERSDEVKKYTEAAVTNQNPVRQWLEHHDVQNIDPTGAYLVDLKTTLFVKEAYASFRSFHDKLRIQYREQVPRVSNTQFITLVSQHMKFGNLVQYNDPNNRSQYWPRSRWVSHPGV